MDARTFKKEEHIKNKLHVNLVVATYNSLPAAIAYNPDQKWYYYSSQKTNEVLVFHQYTKVDSVISNQSCIKTYFTGEMAGQSTYLLSK